MSTPKAPVAVLVRISSTVALSSVTSNSLERLAISDVENWVKSYKKSMSRGGWVVYPIEEILEVRAYLILCSSNHIGDYPRGNDGVEGRVRIITFY